MNADLEAAARRLQLAFDLFRSGEDMMRENLRRDHPDLPPREIEARLVRWLHTRPGAEFGDAVGRPIPWPRRSR